MPLSDSFLAAASADSGAIAVFGVNCVRPLGEAQEVVYYPRRNAEPGSTLQCTKACISDSETAFAMVATKPAWMWGVAAGANECGVTVCCVATFSEPSDGCPAPGRSLLAEDLVRLGLERGRTAAASVDIVCELVAENGLGGSAVAENGCSEQITYACLVFVDKQESWMLEMTGKLWAAKRLPEGYCCIADALTAKATYDKSSDHRQSGSGSQISAKASAAYSSAVKDGPKYCLKQNEQPQDQSPVSRMFHHLRQASTQWRSSERLQRVASMVSVLPRTAKAAGALHWFTATPDPSVSIFKPFVFHGNTKQCLLTVTPEASGEASTSDAYSQLCREHATSVGRLRDNDGRLRDILRQLESECEQEMADYALGADTDTGAGGSEGMGSIFADVCEAEIKFYKKTSL